MSQPLQVSGVFPSPALRAEPGPTGFGHKTLHLRHDADRSVRFRVEVDFPGDGARVY